jgi:thiosulfate/3-mercaptopyruvate sulfurtransferase
MFETLVSRDQIEAHLADPDWRIIDCRFDLKDTERGRRAFNTAHLPNALYAHLDEDLSGPITSSTGRHPLPDMTAFTQTVRRLAIGGGMQVVVYDDTLGSIAVRLWWMLRFLGHRAAALMDGGFPAWQRENRPLSSQATQIPASRFVPRSALTDHIDTFQLERELQSKTCLLLDARAAPRFLGEVEPIDPVAGHVPGAINRPYELNLDSKGDFLAPEILAEAFERQIGKQDPARVVHMCGSGVTACHNLLAMEYAGLKGSRLYPGSWSEWIRDPQRPVARDL